MRLLYFAWVKEKVGRASEEVAIPENVATVAELIAWLKSRGPEFANAFEREHVVPIVAERETAPVAYTPANGGALG